ncbi:DsbA family protein [Metapseudomonas otitidis]|uniref:DsbA family protein n=1 Tax=Metapseudomonas otitidis TaxID=319939 RepID=UPI0013F5A7E6|nr:DsbA family protein [Pseudomonas otitidis]
MAMFTKQKGSSSSTPSVFSRWLTSKVMNYLNSERYLIQSRKRHEKKRLRDGRGHIVEYFHQVDDGYSHLAIQALEKLKTRYDIEFKVHLVPSLKNDDFPELELWRDMSRRDAANVAPYYGLSFNSTEALPDTRLVAIANAVLCRLRPDDFVSVGVEVSSFLWNNNEEGLKELAEKYGSASAEEVALALESGVSRRKKLKHYNTAMFYYEGEWYWGVDRLYHLENRLISLGACKNSKSSLVAPRPEIPEVFNDGAKELILEFFVSLRSPYTAIAWEPTIKLAKDSGINLVVRPVLPMVMRGVPASRAKKIYIATDSSREAKTLGVAFDNFYDPIGEPTLRGYSIYMWASQQNKGNDFIGAFLNGVFARGINANSMSGMKSIVEMAGLRWDEARHHLHDNSWATTLETNRLAMYEFGNWGVPSYRLLNSNGKEILSAWGQDRLWLLAYKIRELSQSR